MTKEIKKKRGVDWIVFGIWALTTVILLGTSCYGYSIYWNFMNCNVRVLTTIHEDVYTDLLNPDPVSDPIEEQNTEKIDSASLKKMRDAAAPHVAALRDELLLRSIIVAVYALITTLIFLTVRGKSNVLTAILIVLIVVNAYLWITTPVYLIRARIDILW